MVKPPQYLKWFYSGVIWNFKTKEKILYLTFDDGPIPNITTKVLEYLDQYNAKATFFCIGENVVKHPEIFESIISKGHQIGNHTFHHYNCWKVPSKIYYDDISAAQRIIPSILFRPPYGKLTPWHILKIKNTFKIIMWDVISCDFDLNVSKETVFNNVINNAQEGSIIVFHDSLKASSNMLFALPKVLEFYANLGYEFKGINF